MAIINNIKHEIHEYYLDNNGVFPNAEFPVLVYKRILDLPLFFPARAVKKLFHRHQWSNEWVNGIYDFHHYHSNTHEVMAVLSGKTLVQLGGEKGMTLVLEKGDVMIIPAGVAHRNLTPDRPFKCVGAYPGGRHYDINVGKPWERPEADFNIQKVPFPEMDPVFGKLALNEGKGRGLHRYWRTEKDKAKDKKITGSEKPESNVPKEFLDY